MTSAYIFVFYEFNILMCRVYVYFLLRHFILLIFFSVIVNIFYVTRLDHIL